ncbi:hypothetical protein Aduo_016322 [Ancylostoma duodenale]
MATLLTSKKRLLTTYANKLHHMLTILKSKKPEDTTWDPSSSRQIQADNTHRLEEVYAPAHGAHHCPE